jgi:RNA polymerase sigma-70 factor (ECF subfamily)
MEEKLRLFRLRGRMSAAARARADAEPPRTVLDRCRAGERAAFEELFALTSARVYSLAYHFLGDAAAAADVTQDVYLKLLVKIDQFRGGARFSSWLYRVVANAVVDYRRARRPGVSLESVESVRLAAAGASPQELLEERERKARLSRAVRRLPPRLRLPLLLRHMAQLSYEEIAAALGVRPGTVASRLARAHRRLAQLIAERDA